MLPTSGKCWKRKPDRAGMPGWSRSTMPPAGYSTKHALPAGTRSPFPARKGRRATPFSSTARAVIPTSASCRPVHYVFADDGRLAERQVVRMPAKSILYRETFAVDGTIRLLNKDGKEVAVQKSTLKPAKEPSLKADTKDLVVLSLPYRNRNHL